MKIVKDSLYRNCVDKNNCQYVQFNEHNVPFCIIDNIIQVKFFGCIPKNIKAFKNNT